MFVLPHYSSTQESYTFTETLHVNNSAISGLSHSVVRGAMEGDGREAGSRWVGGGGGGVISRRPCIVNEKLSTNGIVFHRRPGRPSTSDGQRGRMRREEKQSIRLRKSAV